MDLNGHIRTRRVRLLEEDPDLAADLSPGDLEQASRYAVTEVVDLARGVHDPSRLGSGDLLGLLVIDGLLIRSVQVAERRCGELVGPGSLLRPWDHFGRHAPMPFEVGWRVISPARMALLDQRITMVAARWPALMHRMVARAVERSHALALNVAIHSLQHVELRLLVLMWHLADRFGRVPPEGTVIPLDLGSDHRCFVAEPQPAAPRWRRLRHGLPARLRDVGIGGSGGFVHAVEHGRSRCR